MSDWIVCPHCQLKHSRRPTGLCPKCQQSVDAAAAPTGGAMPDVYDGSLPQRADSYAGGAPSVAWSAAVPLGARIAGGFFILNGLALGLEKILFPAVEVLPGLKGAGTGIMVSMMIDIVIGGLLVTGNEKVLTWAKVRVVLGAILLGGVLIATGNAFQAAIQIAFSTGLLFLLLGEAGRVRIGLGAAVVGLCLALEGLGILWAASGSNPLGRLFMAGQLEKEPAGDVRGTKIPYHLTCPNERWYLRKAEAAHRDNAVVDRWLVRPDKDAHVIVIAETVPGRADMGRFADVVIANARKAATKLEVVDQSPLSSPLQEARLIHCRGAIQGIEVEHYYGLFIQDQYIFQVVGWTHKKNFPEMGDELRQMIASLRYP